MDHQEKFALISVFDKTNIASFVKELAKLGYKIIATGGTAKALIQSDIKVIPIEKITGNPESFDGRMKTISFQIASGILFDRNNPFHVEQARVLNVKKIDIVVCNLYPFEQTVQHKTATQKEIVENIDVGGPTMLRAAAKNFKNVIVVIDPSDYKPVLTKLKSNTITNKTRQNLAAKVFSHLSFYDSQIAKFFKPDQSPDLLTIPGRKTIQLRYGENPHQEDAAVYFEPGTNSPLRNLLRLSGRELSYLNFTDIAQGIESVRLFTKEAAAVVIKHNTPCGIALGNSSAQALKRAIAADPVSAFGGVIVLNKPLDLKTAKEISSFKDNQGGIIDIVAAPIVENKARKLLEDKRKSTGIYQFESIPKKRNNPINLRFFDGGFVKQAWDDDIEKSFINWKVVSKKIPSKKQLLQAKIAWKFITRIRSNAVIIVDKNLPMTRGIGTGQTSRVLSAQIALKQAEKYAKGGILASDSFFPFDDCVKLAAKYKIGAIVQQGGSVNDKASINAADQAGISMIFTNRRAFWH